VLENHGVYQRRLALADPVMVPVNPVIGPMDPLPVPNLKPGGPAPVGPAMTTVTDEPPAPAPQPAPPRGQAIIPAGFQEAPVPRLKPDDMVFVAFGPA
jgi:hypothetical protein